MVPSRCTTAPSSITSATVRLRILQMTYLPRISDRAIGYSSHSGPCPCLLAGRGPQQSLEGSSKIDYSMERFLRNGFGHGRYQVVQGRRQGGRARSVEKVVCFSYTLLSFAFPILSFAFPIL